MSHGNYSDCDMARDKAEFCSIIKRQTLHKLKEEIPSHLHTFCSQFVENIKIVTNRPYITIIGQSLVSLLVFMSPGGHSDTDSGGRAGVKLCKV